MSFDLFSADPTPPDGSEYREPVERAGRRRRAHRRGAIASVAAVLALVAVLPLALRSNDGETSVRANGPTHHSASPPTTYEVPSTTPASSAAETSTTVSLNCHNSFDRRCGPFRWSSQPADQSLAIYVTWTPEQPRAGEEVTFTVHFTDADSPIWNPCPVPSVNFGDGTTNLLDQGGACAHAPWPHCNQAFGAWDLPSPEAGSYDYTLKHTFQEAGTRSVVFSYSSTRGGAAAGGPGNRDETCIEPYASEAATPILLAVSDSSTTTTAPSE